MIECDHEKVQPIPSLSWRDWERDVNKWKGNKYSLPFVHEILSTIESVECVTVKLPFVWFEDQLTNILTNVVNSRSLDDIFCKLCISDLTTQFHREY